MTPTGVERLLKAGFRSVLVEEGAGARAGFSDLAYEKVGGEVVAGRREGGLIRRGWDVVLGVRGGGDVVKEGGVWIAFVYPQMNRDLVERLRKKNATVIGMDCVPRLLSRAQAFDALSSQASVAGYRAVIEAASVFPR